MSALWYDPEAAGGPFSGWGLEFTFRLLVATHPDDKTTWPVHVMNNLARYVHETGNWFEAGHFIRANGPIRGDAETDLVGLLFAEDPELGKISTPHGEVSFLQMVGLMQSELDWLFADPTLARGLEMIEKLKSDNPLLITDLYRRTSVV